MNKIIHQQMMTTKYRTDLHIPVERFPNTNRKLEVSSDD